MISEFGYLLLFIVGGLLFIVVGLFVSFLIRPSRPNEEKLTTYECGEDTVGNAWGSFNIRFYVVALMFVLFDVELVFLFPWATVFGNYSLIQITDGLWGWFALVEMLVFLIILALGLAYAWKRGYLQWVRPSMESKETKTGVPPKMYENINKQYKA